MDSKQATREFYGKLVRQAWITWAKEQPNPKASWLVSWEELPEPDKEADRIIGETVRKASIDSRIEILQSERDNLAAKAAAFDEIRAKLRNDQYEPKIPWGWYLRWLANYDALTGQQEKHDE